MRPPSAGISLSKIYYIMNAHGIPSAGKRPVIGFTECFAGLGPRDRQGRSLRDFDLQRRLFKYPCSYLIYSDALNALPEQVLSHILRRLWEVVTNQDHDEAFSHLTPEDRRAIREILVDTKPGLPDYWKSPAP